MRTYHVGFTSRWENRTRDCEERKMKTHEMKTREMKTDVMADDDVLMQSAVEIKYWTLRFNASEAQIKRAVHAVGTHPARVSAWLKEMDRVNSRDGFGSGDLVSSIGYKFAFFLVGVFGAALFR
jgi:hypothetical protein